MRDRDGFCDWNHFINVFYSICYICLSWQNVDWFCCDVFIMDFATCGFLCLKIHRLAPLLEALHGVYQAAPEKWGGVLVNIFFGAFFGQVLLKQVLLGNHHSKY